jgi:hypothetical protein
MRVRWERVKALARRVGDWFTPRHTIGAIALPVVSGLVLYLLIGGGDENGDSPAPISRPAVERPQPVREWELPRSEEPTDLDLSAAAAHYDSSEDSYGRFRDNVEVEHGDVIGFEVVTRNMENPDSDAELTHLSVAITIPTGYSRLISVAASAHADNIKPSRKLDHSDTVTFTAADDQPFMLGNVRALQVAENANPKPKDGNFRWHGYQYLPQDAVEVENGDSETRYVVRPQMDGTLGSSYFEDFRLFLFADVTRQPS